MNLTADAIQKMLRLKRHPTCGYVSETFRSPLFIPAAQLPASFMGSRALGSVLYFMVTPDAQIILHRVRSDQMYHHYLGDPLEVLLLYPEGDGEVLTVGADLSAGMRPQLFIPGGTFHISRLQRPRNLTPPAGFALLGTTEWPGVDQSDVEIGVPETLMETYPDLRQKIVEFTGRMETMHHPGYPRKSAA